MSRALNVDLTQDQVQAAALKHDAVISSIESLLPRGTRVVLMNADQAANLRRIFKTQLIEGRVVRTPLRVQGK